MALRSMLVLIIVLFCASCTLPINGRDLSKHVHAEHKIKLGGLIGGAQSNKSAGSRIRGELVEAESESFTHFAGYRSKGNTNWYGVRAQINVWRFPDVQPLAESSAYIAAIRDSDGPEAISAGIHISPGLYNDNEVHFFTYWTSDGGASTGCFNLICPGFVIAADSNLVPGGVLTPTSTYGGEMTYITLRIKKDQSTGDWSLYREDKGGAIDGMTLLGWWPKTLFKDLSASANIIQWLGEVRHPSGELSPGMGSGHYPYELEGKAASFYDIFGFDVNGAVYSGDYAPGVHADRPDCYNVSDWYSAGSPEFLHFFYGGPTGCSD